MRRIILSICIMMGALFFGSMSVYSQGHQIANVEVDLNRISVNPPTMDLEMNMVVSGIHVKSNGALILQPVFKNQANQLTLPSVMIVGRDKDISIQRLENKYQSEIDDYKPYVIIKKRRDSQYDVKYSVSVPMQSWVRNSELVVRQSLLCCRNLVCSNVSDLPLQRLSTPEPKYSYVDYVFTPRKEVEDSLRYDIYFENDKSNIDLNYMTNRSVLSDLCKAVKSNNLAKVRLLGSASPIGPDDLNIQLSKHRTQIVQEYLENNCNLNPNKIASRWIGEDWSDLADMLKKSDNVNLKLMSSVIYNVKGGNDARFYTMTEMLSKSELEYVYTDYFPYLRRTSAIIVMMTPSFNLADAKVQMKTSPQNMSQQDMLQVASSYDHDSPDYLVALKTILKYYPDSQAALVNLSSVYLRSSQLSQAKECLDKISLIPIAWNNMGIYYLMSGQDSMAYQYFMKSAEVGSVQAQDNLDKLFYNVI